MFLQIREKNPKMTIFEVITLTTRKMFWPILYTVLTTIIAFLSLIFSEIKPIIDFGWMMTLGLVTSFIITFTLLPTLINLITIKDTSLKEKKNSLITIFFSKVSQNNQKTIFIITGVVIILSLFGVSRLEVENSFINYFSKKTEIYKGMKLINEKLGGTTPLEIIFKIS
jgi:Predicted exporters of the RND superfamily